MTNIDVKKCEQLTIDDFLGGEKITEEEHAYNHGYLEGFFANKTTTTELIRQWAIDRNLHTADPNKQALKLGEEFGELFEGLAKGDEDLTKDALGDMFVVMTILSQQLGFTIEECIELAYNEIKDRKGRMIDGVFVKEADLPKEDD